MTAYASSISISSATWSNAITYAAARVRHSASAILIGLLCVACSTPNPPTNVPLQSRPVSGKDYSFGEWVKAQPELNENLVVLSFSGGGVRAATVATGVLQELKNYNLGSHVALISSTSGGSVTAAVFAAQGYDGIDRLETEFLGKNNMAELIPRMLPRLVLPGANRATAFSDFLDERLMSRKKTTYGDLIRRWPQAPFVVLNATDMSAGSTFEFTQQSFSHLCSDLMPFQLSHAIAASANFPFALNPLPLRNHWDGSRCKEYVPTNADESLAAAEPKMYLYPEMLERARYIHSLRHTYIKDGGIKPDREIRYIHLLDGGLSDNLAARAVLRELSQNLQALQAKKVKKIMVVQVNAKAVSGNDYDNSEGIPSMLDVFWSVTTNPIDVVTELSAYVSRMYLVQLVRASNLQSNLEDKITVYPVYVDFNLITDPVNRKKAQRIKTSWTLPPADKGSADSNVIFLKRLGSELMSAHPCFKHFVGNASNAGVCEFMELVEDKSALPIAPGVASVKPPPPPAEPIRVPPVSEKVSIEAEMLFASGKAIIRPEGAAVLNELSAKFERLNVEVVIVVGHTDSIGSVAANQALSVRRAEAVKAYLMSKGFAGNRIFTEGKGESQPVADNSHADGRAKNRRVTIEVVGSRTGR